MAPGPGNGNGAARWWVGLVGSLLMLSGGMLGWAYTRLDSKDERLQTELDEVRRIQGLRGEDIAALKARVSAIENQYAVMIQQHRDIESAVRENGRGRH